LADAKGITKDMKSSVWLVGVIILLIIAVVSWLLDPFTSADLTGIAAWLWLISFALASVINLILSKQKQR
jgi:hypothetical protein